MWSTWVSALRQLRLLATSVRLSDHRLHLVGPDAGCNKMEYECGFNNSGYLGLRGFRFSYKSRKGAESPVSVSVGVEDLLQHGSATLIVDWTQCPDQQVPDGRLPLLHGHGHLPGVRLADSPGRPGRQRQCFDSGLWVALSVAVGCLMQAIFRLERLQQVYTWARPLHQTVQLLAKYPAAKPPSRFGLVAGVIGGLLALLVVAAIVILIKRSG